MPEPQPSAHHLPHRPWLRRDTPILWRTADTIQVGDGQRTVLISDLPRNMLQWARSLRGDRTLAECLAACPDIEAGTTMLQALALAGALDDAAQVSTTTVALPRALRDRHQRHGAAARLTYADERAHLAVDARANARIGVHGRGVLADAVRVCLRQSGIGDVIATAPPSSSARIGRSQSVGIDLFILAHSWHPQAYDDAGCLALDVPHLPIAAWGSHGVIGPLVIPGLTACLHCAHLHAHDRDPAFASLHLQRSHAQPDVAAVDTGLALAVAAHATLQVCGWVEALGDDQRHPSESQRMHLRLPGGQVESEDVLAHPLCGCRWREESAAHTTRPSTLRT